MDPGDNALFRLFPGADPAPADVAVPAVRTRLLAEIPQQETLPALFIFRHIRDHRFLPGTLQEKLDPYIRPLYDSLFDMCDFERANALIEQGVIEIAPLAFMRGRTLNNAFVILDEAQNTTPEQMKMFLTRLGFSSKFVVTGDTTQRDVPGQDGLDSVRRVLSGMEDISFVDLTQVDIVCHTLVARIVGAYERARSRDEKQAGEARA